MRHKIQTVYIPEESGSLLRAEEVSLLALPWSTLSGEDDVWLSSAGSLAVTRASADLRMGWGSWEDPSLPGVLRSGDLESEGNYGQGVPPRVLQAG